jgi:hypothetical protein
MPEVSLLLNQRQFYTLFGNRGSSTLEYRRYQCGVKVQGQLKVGKTMGVAANHILSFIPDKIVNWQIENEAWVRPSSPQFLEHHHAGVAKAGGHVILGQGIIKGGEISPAGSCCADLIL